MKERERERESITTRVEIQICKLVSLTYWHHFLHFFWFFKMVFTNEQFFPHHRFIQFTLTSSSGAGRGSVGRPDGAEQRRGRSGEPGLRGGCSPTGRTPRGTYEKVAAGAGGGLSLMDPLEDGPCLFSRPPLPFPALGQHRGSSPFQTVRHRHSRPVDAQTPPAPANPPN